MEEHISHPTAQDYREYGVERQEEAVHVLTTLRMKETDIIFLGGRCRSLPGYVKQSKHPLQRVIF
jgi:hypothetical protein